MSEKIDLTDATVNILLEVNGNLYAAAFDKDKLQAISTIVKNGAEQAIKTNKTQLDLINFLNIGGLE